ncbi:hypothetical protein B0H67DRAFT_682834 [Lasiosphaeris hirsuta]|uniref:non-specific serine/threonine protein kinase n=1 Tax=Lasiosphaeris hirsuta TaxID=260670 RepID=A0AA40AS60_9PEZI|nr:hypothetical protein B0H67DRAFT_682834 [Lasiosphaeris hirsuta]
MPEIQRIQHTCPPQPALLLFPLRRPEIERRRNLCEHPDDEATRYLQDRPEGFIFIRWPKKTDGKVQVGLFQAIGNPSELVAIKKMTGESGLSRLPLDSDLTTFPQMLAFQIHRDGPDYKQDLDATIVYKYYNGGTLEDLVERHKAQRKQIPEGLIWHVLVQLAQTLSYLHTGRTNTFSPAPPTWTPIIHADAHLANIWLHHPTPTERSLDPRLRAFTPALPQIILGDFGMAFPFDTTHRRRYFPRDGGGRLPERATWPDKAYLGAVLLHLVFASDPAVEVGIGFSGQGVGGPRDARGQLVLARREAEERRRGRSRVPRALVGYSRDLLEVAIAFERLVGVLDPPRVWSRLRGARAAQWRTWPSNDFVYGHLVAAGTGYVDRYRDSGSQRPVRRDDFLLPMLPDASRKLQRGFDRRFPGCAEVGWVQCEGPESAIAYRRVSGPLVDNLNDGRF